MLEKYGEHMDDKCPRCEKIEKHTHLIQCQSEGATDTFKSTMSDYGAWITTTSLPAMAQALIEFIKANRDIRPLDIKPTWSLKVRKACEKQLAIGTRACVEGCMHPAWERLQKEYLANIGSKKNARRWMKELIQKTCLVSWDMWDSRNHLVHNDKTTRRNQITAILHQDVQDIHGFARSHRFLPCVAKEFFATPINTILTGSDYNKRIWKRIGERYLDNDRKRMARNPRAALMQEWLIPRSLEGRNRHR